MPDTDKTTPATISKRELAERIAAELKLSVMPTLQVIQTFLDEIVSELSKGNRLEFRDFGVFEPVIRKARVALNPKTLKKVPIASRRMVKFKAGRIMKQQVIKLPVEA